MSSGMAHLDLEDPAWLHSQVCYHSEIVGGSWGHLFCRVSSLCYKEIGTGEEEQELSVLLSPRPSISSHFHGVLVRAVTWPAQEEECP